jgi:hypothetical protein
LRLFLDLRALNLRLGNALSVRSQKLFLPQRKEYFLKNFKNEALRNLLNI